MPPALATYKVPLSDLKLRARTALAHTSTVRASHRSSSAQVVVRGKWHAMRVSGGSRQVAYHVGVIASALEQLWQKHLLVWEHARSRINQRNVNARVRSVAARHDGGPCRGASTKGGVN